MAAHNIYTYQTRIPDHPALDDYAELFGRVQRALFAETRAGGSAAELKTPYLRPAPDTGADVRLRQDIP